MSATPFKAQDRVVLSRVLHTSYRGQVGTVERYVKSRGVYVIRCDNGERYDAFPTNLDPEATK